MAGEVLKDAGGILADLPDNSSGLIVPQVHRSEVVSVVNAVGFLEDDPATVPVTLPMTDGVPTDVLSQLVAPLFVGQFWELQPVTNAFVPSYGNAGVTVEPDTIRLLQGTIGIRLNKVGGGTATYEFEGTQGGTFTGNPVQRTIGITPEVFWLSGDRLYDVYAGDPVSFSITPIGTSDDLVLTDLRVKLIGSLI